MSKHYAADLIAVAVKEIGTVEQPGNRQKYGKAYGIDGVYWCMQFVWWCFQRVDRTLFMDGGKTASCGKLMRWAQAHGQWVTKGFKPGDVLIYDFPSTEVKTDHTGICESVSGQYVTAIEGNTSSGVKGSQANGDGVYRKKRALSLVIGAYRPKYDVAASSSEAKNNSGSQTGKAAFKVGDIVDFKGSKHYTSSNATSGVACKGGKAKVTAVSKGAKHPYHLVKQASPCTVYGWVDAADISAVSTTNSQKTYTVVAGDSLWGIAQKKLGNGSRYKEIMSLNGLTSTSIRPGQKLKLP